MKNPLIRSTAILAAAVILTARGAASTLDTSLRLAELAWEKGDYVTALSTYLRLLDSLDADRVLEPIALQTGELYVTTELTADGGAPRFSPDGSLLVYETGAPLHKKTRLLRTEAVTTTLAQLEGYGAAFTPDGSRLAYLQLESPSSALVAAQAASDAAPTAERQQRLAALNRLLAAESRLVTREVSTGREVTVDRGGVGVSGPLFCVDGILVFSGFASDAGPPQIYVMADRAQPRAVTTGEGEKVLVDRNATGTAVLFTIRVRAAGRPAADEAASGGGSTFGVVSLPAGKVTMIAGTAPSFSADGLSLTYVRRRNADYQLMAASVADLSTAAVVRSGAERLDAPALSPDGTRIAYQLMPKEDWEIFVINRDGTAETRVTREIQHDVLPRFLAPDRLMASIGEPRHRRSYLYDLQSGARTRLFHNNTVRTVAPEYAWISSVGGNRILISAERDGNTVSPERGVYLVDLSRKVTRADVRARVAANLASEQALHDKGQRMYAPLAAAVKAVVADASIERVFGYEKALFDFDSKHISRPGNRLASAFLFDTYKSFGYEPAYQWFEPRTALGGRTANVIATLQGTVNPNLIYVVSSHYDSVAAGPGADDDSSGTAALLETARLLVGHPQPATIIFASFTGEEAGLLGSREFVRRAVADKLQIVGALNNDMIGWANDYRLDNTIRYSNPGIRDVQHCAAMQFTNLITYDALYYKSTDAAAYYEAYGDIVGGIGSYPVLGNPHYHQSHDLLEGINHQLVTEVAKTTAATLMLLASSPSRLNGVTVNSFTKGTAVLSWEPAVERDVTGYVLTYGPDDKPQRLTVSKPTATLTGVTRGTTVAVKAVNGKGLESWDSAKVVVE